MNLSRVVIQRIPTERQKAAMPDVELDQRVESETPVSGWLEMLEAMELASYLRSFYPVLIDDSGAVLIYAMQNCTWPDDSIPPARVAFDPAAVGRAHASFKLWMPMSSPSFSIDDWTVIKDALNAVQGDGRKTAQRVVRSVRGHIANMTKQESERAAVVAGRESGK